MSDRRSEMTGLRAIYRPSLALLTDLYQLTMAQSYWKVGVGEHEAVFHLFFRENPFRGEFAITAGLAFALNLLRDYRFDETDLGYLAGLRGNDERPLFDEAFLEHLRELRLTCDVDAIPEGTVAFPHEPLVRVRGPVVQAQLFETPLLNLINFQTLVATKAARVCLAAGSQSVLEFGLRRAQGADGGVSASRAAYIGGCAATSNVLAGKLFDIPVKGTHAHSWVMLFDSETEAFEAYASAMPNNCVFLVDTYDTLAGVRRAVEVGRKLHERGHAMAGVRLDSGDLADLSKAARRILDEAGFEKAMILGSGDLDEHLIRELNERGAAIDVWGVGTRLATAYDQPALGGVYKLSAVREPGGEWRHKVKRSEQTVKTSNPGILQVRRYQSDLGFVADVVFDLAHPPAPGDETFDPTDPTLRRKVPCDIPYEDLLVPVLRQGNPCYQSPPLAEIRERARRQVGRLGPDVKRLAGSSPFPVSLERNLHELKTRLLREVEKSGGA